MFDPTIGRWIQEDPTEFGAGDENFYRFVENNPINLVDPSGLEGVNSAKIRGEHYEAIKNRRVSTDAAIRKVISDNKTWNDAEKQMITDAMMRLTEASRFTWWRATGFFGACGKWADHYYQNTGELRMELRDKGIIGQYMQIEKMEWGNKYTEISGHAGIRIALNDGTTFYLDDGHIGDDDHVFMDSEVPSRYIPVNTPPGFEKPPAPQPPNPATMK